MQKIPGTAQSMGSMGRYPYSPEIEGLCTFNTQYDEEPVVLSRRDGGQILVPRQMVRSFDHDTRTIHPVTAHVCTRPPRDEEQKRVLTECLDNLHAGQDHIVECPTGWGKGWLASAVTCAFGQATLIVVTKQDLMDQMLAALRDSGIPDNMIGRVQADVCDFRDKPVTVAMIHSVSKPGRYEPDLYRYFGLLIMDEVHKVAADTFSNVCALFPTRHRLGLSATTKRPDGKSFVLEAHIGPVLVHGHTVPMKPKILIKHTGWSVPMVKRGIGGHWVSVPMEVSPGRMMGVYNKMAADPARNAVIGEFVQQAYGSGRTTLVLADTIVHLQNLFQKFAGLDVPGERIGYYIGGMSKEELKSASRRSVILATYGMVAEGTDCPWWDTAIPATPRANIKQPLGRILRKLEGKRQPVWCDLVDEGSVFRAFANKRLQQFYELGADIKKL